MSREVWATYSVKDHLNPRALAADIMLFDRLVFPVPQTAEIKYEETASDGRGPVVWRRNLQEWQRWKDWDPDAQESLLELLAPVVRKVPWDTAHQEAWRKEFAAKAEDHLPDYAFIATRTVLTRDLPAYVTGVEAMGPAYRSVEQMRKELGLKETGKQGVLPGNVLTAVLGWEFLIPDDPRLSNAELLKETIGFVTGDEDFRSNRSQIWTWQQKYLKNGLTDRESIAVAISEMRDLLEKQKAAAKRLPMDNALRCAFRVAPAAVTLAGVFLGRIGEVGGAEACLFLSCAEMAAEKWFFKEPTANAPSPAAFVYDAQRHFGWK